MRVYGRSFTEIVFWTAFGIILWSYLGVLVKKSRKASRIWKAVNAVGMLAALYGILSYTVLNRTQSEIHQFTFFATYTNEFYREMLMNAFLYYPLGLTASVFIGPWVVLIGFLISVGIETWQYFAGTGVAQGTDVIMNTLGTAIGAVPWPVIRFCRTKKNRNID